MKFTKSHEWLGEGDPAPMGITIFAAEAMGDIVYFEFLVAAGDEVAAGEPLCEIESVKTSAQAYAPHDGTVVARNEELSDDPAPLGEDPQGAGWILSLSPGGGEGLMDADAYAAHCDEEG